MSNPQQLAADPDVSAFVRANAGSGKTSTLVDRVARLLLRGAPPEAILCVTYTKAAAAEMQRRLYDKLGGWAVMADEGLAEELARIEEPGSDPREARRLFAQALETPGGLKIQTIHAFCEKLLRRFPIEAGLTPGFTILEDVAAAEVSAEARDLVALAALADPEGELARAYAHLSVQVDYQSFQALFAAFEARRTALERYFDATAGDLPRDVYDRAGLDRIASPEVLEAEAVAALDRAALRRAAEALLAGSEKTDRPLGERMLAWLAGEGGFDALWRFFSTDKGQPSKTVATSQTAPAARDWLLREQARLARACADIRAARVGRDTLAVLTLAIAYVKLYEGEKARHGGLDFADLIARTHDLLTVKASAAWVLFKLDGGVDHLLLDEAQDTAPDQWDILRALTAEFFAGAGAGKAGRTVFAVGDEKQSIYSFQGAAPERLRAEADEHAALAGEDFREVALLESWRSTPDILQFVDAVFSEPDAVAALQPAAPGDEIRHLARRDRPGLVDIWPLEVADEPQESDPWAPVDAEPPEGANKKLARRIAREVRRMIDRREAVYDRGGEPRPLRPGDVLILVRRRGGLFHEVMRALKREGVPVGGQDRLTLSDHIVFKDLIGIARFALFPGDDLTLAALLRSPFCDIDEQGLFDLAQPREGSLWGELNRRAAERPVWLQALDLFGYARGAASQGPFDFYARLLTRLDAAGRSMRQRLLTRLGREAEDALDAFLAETLKAERRGVHDLETFAAEMAATAIEVKREQEDEAGRGPGAVRVMTVHGAKGLEAPLVILPDTTSRPQGQGPALLETVEGGFLFAPRKAEDCEASASARADREGAQARETLRLLYVALTRPRDRLILCGVRRADRKLGYETGSWWQTIDEAAARSPLAEALRPVRVGDLEIRRFGADPIQALEGAADVRAAAAVPAWAHERPRAEPASRYASPSTLAEFDAGSAPSPLASVGGLGRFRRGELIHQLLQLLPDIAAAERPAAARDLLARERDLSEAQRQEMAAAALAVLDDTRFAEVFGPGSRAEVAIAGTAASLPQGLAISGRIDRLVALPGRVLVVDFKTNRPAPARAEDVDRAYLTQMALYWAVLKEVFPERTVEAALVWTDGPKLMPLSENLIAKALAELGRAG